MRIDRNHPAPKNFWSYPPTTETPTLDQLPAGAFNGTSDQWESFSPGMRREIARDAKRRLTAAAQT
jgi:hypothetical protein